MVERDALARGECLGAVETDVRHPRRQFRPRAQKRGAGQHGDARLLQQPLTQGDAVRNAALRQPLGERRKIGKEIEGADRRMDTRAGVVEHLVTPAPQRGQDPPRVRQIPLDRNPVLEGPDRGILNRRAHRGVGFAGDRGHGRHQPGELRRKGERPQPPAPGPAPFGQAGTDDRALGIEARDRHVPALVMQLPVDLVGQQNHPEPPGDRGQGFEFLRGIAAAVRVAGVIQNEDARPVRVGAADFFHAPRGDAPVLLERRVDDVDRASDDVGLRGVRHPGRRRHEQFAVEDELQQEQEFLGPGSDEHALGLGRDAVLLLVELGDRFAQGGQAGHGQIVFFVGVLFERVHHVGRHGKRRLPETERGDAPPLAAQRPTAFVDGQRGRRFESPYA